MDTIEFKEIKKYMICGNKFIVKGTLIPENDEPIFVDNYENINEKYELNNSKQLLEFIWDNALLRVGGIYMYSEEIILTGYFLNGKIEIIKATFLSSSEEDKLIFT